MQNIKNQQQLREHSKISTAPSSAYGLVIALKEANHHLEINLKCWTHGTLDVQNLDILPVLLEQGDQEINSKLNIQSNISIAHGNVRQQGTYT